MRRLLLALTIAGCTATPEEVRERVLLKTSPTVPAGGELEVSLENDLLLPVDTDLCRTLFTPSLVRPYCTLTAVRVEPGQRSSMRFATPPGSAAGAYVAHVTVRVDDTDLELSSAEFTVTAP